MRIEKCEFRRLEARGARKAAVFPVRNAHPVRDFPDAADILGREMKQLFLRQLPVGIQRRVERDHKAHIGRDGKQFLENAILHRRKAHKANEQNMRAAKQLRACDTARKATENFFLRQLFALYEIPNPLIEQRKVAEFHRELPLFLRCREFRKTRRRRAVLQTLGNHGLHLFRKARLFDLALPEGQLLFQKTADAPHDHRLAALIHNRRELHIPLLKPPIGEPV